MMRKMSVIAMFALLLISVLPFVQAAKVPATIEDVWINDDKVTGNEVRGDILRGDEIEVKVKLFANATVDNLQLSAEITGDEHSDIEATTETFDVKVNQTYFKTLTLSLPKNLDQDQYAVRVELSDRKNDEVVKTITLDVNTARHAVEIDDVLFSPSGPTLQAGRSLLTKVRVANIGERDEDNLKVTVDVEGIGSDADFIEEVESEDETMTEELFIRVPECTPAGQYKGTVTLLYDDDTKTVKQPFTLTVLVSDRCPASGAQQRTVITVGSDMQNVAAGGTEVVYPVALTNEAADSKTYTLELNAGDWASSRLSSNVLVVGPKETKVAYVYVAAKDNATPGEKTLSLSVKSNGQTLKDVQLRANVTSSATSYARPLAIVLIVLVVLLVVIGIVLGFSRMKGGDDEDEKEEKTYY